MNGCYEFEPSDRSLLKFFAIKRQIKNDVLETPQELYLRMRNFIEENILRRSALRSSADEGDLVIAPNNDISALTERLVILRWLEVLHSDLPELVSKAFAGHLRTKSLHELQPIITERLDELLRGRTVEEIKACDISSIVQTNTREEYLVRKRDLPINTESSRQYSDPLVVNASYTVGTSPPLTENIIPNHPKTSPPNDSVMFKTFSLDIKRKNKDRKPTTNTKTRNSSGNSRHLEPSLNQSFRFTVEPSPKLKVKIRDTYVTMLVDTGASGSMISQTLCEQSGLKIYPSPHTASQADGDSTLKVIGEIHTTVLLDDRLHLPIHAVVVTRLKAGLLAGMSFMKENRIVIDVPRSFIMVDGNDVIAYNVPMGQEKIVKK